MQASEKFAHIHFRMGEARDADAIAHLYNVANNGLSENWWHKQAKNGETWQQAFARDILLPESVAHYARCIVAEHEGKVIGLLLALPQERLMPADKLSFLPSSERNILELRRLAEGSLFIAVVAVEPDFRKNGVARHFVNLSTNVAGISNFKEMSIIIQESNKDWLASFLRRGFTERARNDVGDHAVYPAGSNWILLMRPLNGQG